MKVKKALLSVSDKSGIVELAQGLHKLGVEILSTGGTASLLREKGVSVTEVSAYTGFPEIMGGRVKTLHPKIYGALLGVRTNPSHRRAMKAHGIEPIDLVAVNLYPFEKTISKPDCTMEDAIENIDVGGPCMVRASAKNHKDVIILVSPSQYEAAIQELEQTGDISLEKRRQLAIEAYRLTSHYDEAIAVWLGSRSG